MAAFAEAADFKARQLPGSELAGLPDALVEKTLEDASAYMEALYLRRHGRPWKEGDSPLFDSGAEAVCCDIAARCLSRPMGLAGVTQFSQTAGPFTGSATFGSSATGSPRILAEERLRLGLAGGRMGSIRAACGEER